MKGTSETISFRGSRMPFFLLPLALLLATASLSEISFAAPEKAHWAGKRLDPKNGAPFGVALARDARNDIWIGTEDNGIWHFNTNKQEWKQFTIKDGLGDNNAYSLVVDKLGRVWAGHLNHGVSVWNGVAWKNFDALQGPLGERVFALAVNPFDGDVWAATNAGLSRYSVDKDSWMHFTRASGLPSHKISTLTFDSVGNLYVGTQCNGLAIARAQSDYREWTRAQAPDEMPDSPIGNGLPSNFINDVLVSDDDTIYVATDRGLARSKDKGAIWSFVRGVDWKSKLQGLYAPRTPRENTDWNGELLREDYVSNIAEDEKGLIWIGYRLSGFEVRRPLSDRILFASSTNEGDRFSYVSTLLPLGDGTALIASYGDGLSLTDPIPAFTPGAEEQKAINARRGWRVLPDVESLNGNPKFPTPSKAPSPAELDLMLVEAQAVPVDATRAEPFVLPLDDDWTTQGDWLGRYGRYFAVGCAMLSPRDYIWGAGAQAIEYDLRIDPREKGNSLRYWVHWLQTDNRRALEMPPVYADSRLQLGLAKENELRRQSEVDDNGEGYPLTKEGPDVYASLKIPAGLWTLSFYNHNKDGHDGFNRARDYKISIRQRPQDLPLSEVGDFEKWPELARNRQRDFWGGVYQKYLVRGPQNLSVRYAKNNSFNTILAGIFLDGVDEEPAPYFSSTKAAFGETEPQLPEAATVSKLWTRLEQLQTDNPKWWASEHRRFHAPLLRWHEAARLKTTSLGTPRLTARLGTGYHALNLFPKWEETQRKRGLVPARDVEKSLRFDVPTQILNGGDSFSGRGRFTVLGSLARQASQSQPLNANQPPLSSTR